MLVADSVHIIDVCSTECLLEKGVSNFCSNYVCIDASVRNLFVFWMWVCFCVNVEMKIPFPCRYSFKYEHITLTACHYVHIRRRRLRYKNTVTTS